jgi:beta-lactamase class D
MSIHVSRLLARLAVGVCMIAVSHVAAASTLAERADFKPLFDAAGTDGTLLIYDLNRDAMTVYNPARAQTLYSPASTFKIFNSLIGLETGVVKDVDQDKLPWDGKVFLINGKPMLPEVCNADLPLRVAFPKSCIPAYQALARRVGTTKYKHYLTAAHYGNQNLDGPVDWFWLNNGKLRISAYQQIDFLKQLVKETLPFSPQTYAQTKDIMIVEKTPDYTLRAKTGYADAHKPVVGWWIGWVERGDNAYLFALNLDLLRPEHSKARLDITKSALKQLGVL